MNVRKAIDETMELARNGADHSDLYHVPDSSSFQHVCDMYNTINSDQTMSDTKLCRWLGWMQASVVSWGLWTLEDMKEINKRNADA